MDSNAYELKPIGGKTIVEQIIDQIIDSILCGQYKAGMKLPSEFELMEQLQVGRNSVREAMKLLSAMGIVEVKRGDGTYVCSQLNPTMFDRVVYSIIYDMSSSGELLELRQILDAAVLKLAIEKATAEDVARLQENIRQHGEAVSQMDIEAMKRHDLQFHLLLIESCKNQFFIRIMRSIYHIFEKSMGRNIESENISSQAVEHHQRMLDCIRHRNYANVDAVISDSLATWKDCIKRDP